jgi:hypothetical protein
MTDATRALFATFMLGLVSGWLASQQELAPGLCGFLSFAVWAFAEGVQLGARDRKKPENQAFSRRPSDLRLIIPRYVVRVHEPAPNENALLSREIA